jgi:hypothetical protein
LIGKASFEQIWRSLARCCAVALLALAGTQAVSAQTITSIQPSTVPEGTPQFNMLVSFTNYLPTDIYQVIWTIPGLQPTIIPLTTTVVSPGLLQAVVPVGLVSGPYTAMVDVHVFGTNTSSPLVPFIVTGPVITSLSPPSVVVGSPTFALTVNGSGFVEADEGDPVVYFGNNSGSALSTTYIGNGQLVATVPSYLLGTVGTVPVYVYNGDETVSPNFNFYIVPPPPQLQLPSQSMPPGTVGFAYNFTFQTVGGTPPVTFTATGLPGTLTLNNTTGTVSGTPNVVGTYTVTVTATDSGTQVVRGQYPLTVGPPPYLPLQFLTSTPPAGQVGVPYSSAITAAGGTPPYIFALAGGSLPTPLTFTSGGGISGTPTKAGISNFTVLVTDALGATVSQGFTLTIVPPPLTVTAATLTNSPAGIALALTFGATGGYPPYTFGANSGIPSGATFNSNGTLTGTPTVPGIYSFIVTVKDSTGATASQAFSLTITPPPLTILTTTLPNGQVGVFYSVQFFGTNGQPPYTWAASGGPAGVTMSATGLLSGTPTAAGPFTVAVTVTDAAKNTASQTYTITIAAAPLLVSTTSLPGDVAGTAYNATLAATGGVSPYTWTVQGLPAGIAASMAGALTGAPTSSGTYTVTATVTDSKGTKASATLILTVTAIPLSISTTTLPNGTVSVAYSAALTATGGAGSNKWSATGLPGGLTISAGGTISGAPTAGGLSVVVVTVTDAAGTVGVQTLTLAVLLPVAPALTFSGIPPTVSAGTQSNLQVGLASAYPLPVTVTLTLAFTPTSGADDPAVQFSTGGRVTVIQIPAGSPAPVASAALQTGTVAGTITITADLTTVGQDITPSPAPQQTVVIPAAAPSITSVTAVATGSTLTVTVIGFSTPRSVTQGTFTFAAPASAGLQTSSVTVPATSLFSTWYASAASAPFGSQFSFVQSFNVTGNAQGITSVTVTLTNAQGTSTPVTANVQQ